MTVYVGIDLHRKRSQVAVLEPDGKQRLNRNVRNDSPELMELLGALPTGTPVAFEAAYGWSWLLELLEDCELGPHLAHPSRCKAIASARLKDDRVDARTLAQLLRADLLPEAWIAPAPVRELRVLLRHRVVLVRLRTSAKNRIHAVLADHGLDREQGLWSGPGRDWLAGLKLPPAARLVVDDHLALIDSLAGPLAVAEAQITARAKPDPRVKVLAALPGVGQLTAMTLLAEIGDITRFASARKLCAWAGLTPGVRNSDRKVRHGHITKAGAPVGAVDPARGRPASQAPPGLRPPLRGHRPPARQEHRYRRRRPQAAGPRLPPAHRTRQRPPRPPALPRRVTTMTSTAHPADRQRWSPAPGALVKPHEPETRPLT